ncbi:MAG: hypothetical protein WBF51_04125 [Candidatus Dormiibacterota bacterium]
MASGPFKLGRLPATRPYGLSDLSVYAAGKLPDPPTEVAVPKAVYPIDGNDQYGDCTMAGVAHLIAAWNAEVSVNEAVPDSQEVVEEYFRLSGGQDTGLNEANVLQTWHREGLFGHKLDAYAPVNVKDLVELHQAVAFYGGCYLGIECPQSAQEQFQAGEPWTFVPGSPIEGGHCIVALGYTPEGLLCATWGGIALVTFAFLAHFLEEAWAIVAPQFVAAGKGPSLDLKQLKADLP